MTLERMNTLSEAERQSGEIEGRGDGRNVEGEQLQGGRRKGKGRETAALSAKSRSIEISAGIAKSVERTRMETGGQRQAMQHHLS